MIFVALHDVYTIAPAVSRDSRERMYRRLTGILTPIGEIIQIRR